MVLFSHIPILAEDLVDYVNPLIGTKGWFNSSLYGGTIPGVTRPFGMIQWTPMTRLNKIGSCPYRYEDSSIMGFLGTRQPSVWMGDYGYVSLMPGIGKVRTGFKERQLPYRHKNEVTTPYYYQVKTPRFEAEVTASLRSSLMRFSFYKNRKPHVIIDASRDLNFPGYIKVEPEKNRVLGYNSDRHSASLGPSLPNFKGYFIIEFDAVFIGYGVYIDDFVVKHQVSAEGDKIGAYVRFPKGTKIINARISTSLISLEQAQENLEKELPHWEMESLKQDGRKAWNKQLSKIRVKGASPDDRHIFYTAMYHSHLFPRVFSEYGHYYSAFDDQVHKGIAYNDYSLWDTFRAEHPLLLLTVPERTADMITSLIQMYQQGGWLPKWPNPTYTGIMIGSHADSVIADAWVKGIRGFDLEKAYEAVYKNAMIPPDGDENKRWEDRAPWTSVESRGGLSWYIQLGYVPLDKTDESVSRTLEFAYDDFCAAQLALASGRLGDYDILMGRSKNYLNLYKNGYFQARNSNGTWAGKKGYTESLKWGYLFCVMQDIPGLIELMGGVKAFERKLEKIFAPIFRKYRYLHTNEPVHHYVYLFNYSGSSWKTQEQSRMVMKEYYQNSPSGLYGNDDCGQMSAWYIFSSIGFYPVTPGTELYAMGSPIWDEVMINLDKPYDKTAFRILVQNQAPKNIYIQSAYLNGKSLNTPFLKHSQIVEGGDLVLEMGPRPNKNWGNQGIKSLIR